MEKQEDLDLLELKELAFKHLNVPKHLSLEQKRLIAKAYLQNHVPMSQLCKDFGIARVTIWRWIRTFADGKMPERSNRAIPDVKPNPSIMPRRKQQTVESEVDELIRLREENKRLSEALKMSEWMNHAKDVMIDEAEKMFNIPIRKKSGAKQ